MRNEERETKRALHEATQLILDMMQALPKNETYDQLFEKANQFVKDHETVAVFEGYAVEVGLSGLYIPHSIYYCPTLQDARNVAKNEKRAFQDAGYRVSGNIHRDNEYIVTDPEGGYGTEIDWQRITINPVYIKGRNLEHLVEYDDIDENWLIYV